MCLYYSDQHIESRIPAKKIMIMNGSFGRVFTVLWFEVVHVHVVKFDFTTLIFNLISLCSHNFCQREGTLGLAENRCLKSCIMIVITVYVY